MEDRKQRKEAYRKSVKKEGVTAFTAPWLVAPCRKQKRDTIAAGEGGSPREEVWACGTSLSVHFLRTD